MYGRQARILLDAIFRIPGPEPTMTSHYVINRLEYIMLLNLPITLSSNSLPIIPIFILIYSPPRSTIKLLTITNYIIHTQLHSICIH